MSIQTIPRNNGKAILSFGYGNLTRNTLAWNPDTGKACKENEPRISTNRIPVFNFSPKIYYNFAEPHTFMDYDSVHPLGSGYYFSGVGGRDEDFTAAFPEFTRITLGSGLSFQNREIIAYRLPRTNSTDPLHDKHAIFICGVHGNEMHGVDGVFKACEILARHSDFQNFRDEWTLLFIPVLNPDGWYLNLRNLRNIGPNSYTVNLNRNFNWFWDEYVESGSESKGTTPGDSLEAKCILDYIASLHSGGRVGALFDFHATANTVTARYQSRDRCWNHILHDRDGSVDPSLHSVDEVPDNYLTMDLDYHIFNIARGVQTRR